MNKHENYEILNLIGYGLAKFDNDLIQHFNFKSKIDFFKYCVKIGLAATPSVIKNRMDLFDPFFPNHRKGWWQKKDAYRHRKIFIDNLFGNENALGFANIIKLYLKNQHFLQIDTPNIKPILQSKFKKLQTTGLEAELFFINNFKRIDIFKKGSLEDARLYGDGYDFQITTENNIFLSEIKGIRHTEGTFRLTENEFIKAKEYKNNYIITVVLNLNNNPRFITIPDPVHNLKFHERWIQSKINREYHYSGKITLDSHYS